MDNNLQKYLAFVKTVETGSFTKAAEKLNYAQSSVSKMIGDLEKEWNVVLLERDKRGVHLTTVGEQLLPYARQLIDDYNKLSDYVNDINGVQTGTIRIGTFSSVAINWLPNIFAEFQKDYPFIEYEILLGDYGQVEQWIEEGRVDCGFLSLPMNPKFHTISLKQDEYKVILPKNHPLSKNKKIEIKDLENQPFMLLEQGGRTEVTKILEKNNVKPNVRFSTWEDFAIMSMVEKGLGIGILPDMILQRIPYDVEIRPLKNPYFREIGLAVKDESKMSPAMVKFLEYVKYREKE